MTAYAPAFANAAISRILRLLLIIAAVFTAGLATANAVFATAEPPEKFLDSIYKRCRSDSKIPTGISLATKAEIERYFEPSIAALIAEDFTEAEKLGEPPNLNGDPFVCSQEWNIRSFNIKVRHRGRDKAEATVRFTNYDAEVTVHVVLVRLPKGWRIVDIASNKDKVTLREIYTRK